MKAKDWLQTVLGLTAGLFMLALVPEMEHIVNKILFGTLGLVGVFGALWHISEKLRDIWW